MTVGAEPRPAERAGAPRAARCVRCGTPLADDQEWCLECGTARTVIQRPGSWRIPMAVLAAVTLLVLAGFAIALINLSSEANRSAAAQSTSSTSAAVAAAPPAVAAAPPAVAAAPPAGASGFPGWRPGATGWTVELASSSSRAAAAGLAAALRAAGASVGILDSSRHPAMKAGQWVVFSGRYPSLAAARAQARVFGAHGHPGIVRFVAPRAAR